MSGFQQEWFNYLGSEAGLQELKAELEQGPSKSTLAPCNLQQHLDLFCAHCGDIGLKRCGKCHEVKYCSRPCQVAHWKAGHKARCGVPGAAQADVEAAIARSGRQYMMVVNQPPQGAVAE